MTALPSPPPEIPAVTSLDPLAPRFRAAVERVLEEMQKAGFDPIISETLRSDARQKFLYGFGRRYDDGRGVVTHADSAFVSWHGYGLAADIISRAEQWDAPDSFWRALGAAAKDEGLTWGGNWPGDERDLPHIQWGSPMRNRPSPRAEQLRDQGGLPAVWAEVKAA